MKLYKLYPIRVDLGEFRELSKYYPGTTPSGEQVIIFERGWDMHSYRFDADGRYLGREDVALADWVPKRSPQRRSHSRLAGVQDWAKSLGLTPAIIHIRKFQSGRDSPTPGGYDGPQMAIYDQPSYFEDGDLGTDEQRAAKIKWWRDKGAFVEPFQNPC